MQILKNRVLMSMVIALACLWQAGAVSADSSCATPDNNLPNISTCYFDLTQSPSTTLQTPSTALLNGGIFSVPDSSGSFFQSTTGNIGSPIVGTGVLNPFIRIQGANGNKASGVESGYNTGDSVHVKDAGVNLLQDHDNGNTNWNHAIQLGSLATVNVGGVDYYQFILDINEQNNNPNGPGLSLDEFKLFYADSGDISTTSGTCSDGAGSGYTDCGVGGGAQLAYNMDASMGGDASILMDYSNFSGSGYGIDLQALVPVANFANKDGTPVSPDSYVYLYSKFGATGDTCQKTTCMQSVWNDKTQQYEDQRISKHAGSLSMVADAGFEEWSARCKTGACLTVPEPETLALMGLGIIGMIITRRRATV